jgi:hypothetical protein
MNELIPTTAHVRDAYSSESTDSKYSNRMFDLWLAQYKAKVIAKAEERIIKLLDDYCDNNHFLECECASQLALIKGENK